MSNPQEIPNGGVAETPEQKRDRCLVEWQAAKALLDTAKTDEMTKRKAAFEAALPDAHEGTNKADLGNGWTVKGVRKITYKIPNDNAVVGKVEAEIMAIGNEGPYLAGLILKRVYDFSAGEYKKLDPNNPTHLAVKRAIDTILVTDDGAPTLEIIPPKETKTN